MKRNGVGGETRTQRGNRGRVGEMQTGRQAVGMRKGIARGGVIAGLRLGEGQGEPASGTGGAGPHTL